MTPFSFLFLLTLAAPSQSFGGPVPPAQFHQAHRALPPNYLARADCYSIRSYVFERHDGNAPELVGETTCTPANQAGPQMAKKPQMSKKWPQVRLVPMKQTAPEELAPFLRSWRL
jgi:hypothetical protein